MVGVLLLSLWLGCCCCHCTQAFVPPSSPPLHTSIKAPRILGPPTFTTITTTSTTAMLPTAAAAAESMAGWSDVVDIVQLVSMAAVVVVTVTLAMPANVKEPTVDNWILEYQENDEYYWRIQLLLLVLLLMVYY
jgi:hypothetical protein